MFFSLQRRTSVWCTFQAEGWHNWPNAPEHYAYLRNSHRHMFGVRVEISVTDPEREIEFIDLKHTARDMFSMIRSVDHTRPAPFSCETMCDKLMDRLLGTFPDAAVISVSVDEDGENGATIVWKGAVDAS